MDKNSRDVCKVLSNWNNRIKYVSIGKVGLYQDMDQVNLSLANWFDREQSNYTGLFLFDTKDKPIIIKPLS